MNRVILVFMLCSIVLAQEEEITLSGVTAEDDTALLEGVVVSLLGHPELKDTTDAEGKFLLSNGVSTINSFNRRVTGKFSINGRSISFSPYIFSQSISVSLFRTDGKKIFSRNVENIQSINHTFKLPEPGSGIYMLQIVIGEKIYTQPLISIGAAFFLSAKRSQVFGNDADYYWRNASAGEAVDTLLAVKKGYDSVKFPLESYNKSDIAITMEKSGSGGVCTRESMKTIVDKYIEAQEAGDPSLMPLAADAEVFENTEEMSLEESFLSTAMKIDLHRSFYDVDSCRTFSEVIVATTKPTAVMGVSLRIVGDKITEVEAIITREGDWLYNAADYLKYSKQEENEWYILPEEKRSSREFLIDAGDQYLDLFNGDNEDIPWGAPCARLEGGSYTNTSNNNNDNCHWVLPGGSNPFLIGDREYIVDLEMGTCIIFCAFCVLDSHMFRVVDSHFRLVHTLTVGCD